MPPEEVLREVQGWITKAENDLKNVALVLPAEDAPFDTVCFHAQQAAEKYLKALLTFRGIPFGRTHDLPELVLLLPPDSAMPAAVGDLSELTDAAVACRYPVGAEEYNRPLTEELVRQARAVRAAALAELRSLGYARQPGGAGGGGTTPL